MKTACTTRSCIAAPVEHLLILMLIQLTLYVTPCAMEMPALLAALLQDAGAQHHMPYEDFSEPLLPPQAPVVLPADVTPVEVATINEQLNGRKEMLNEVAELAGHAKNEIIFDGILPPVMATAGASLILPEIKQHTMRTHTSSPASSSSSLPSPLNAMRRCSIEIITKVPGICQAMPHNLGNACVAGDYMDVFNMECLNGY